MIIETLGAFTNKSPANKSFEGAERGMILGSGEAKGIANRVRASGAPDAVDVILGMFGEVVIDDV
jgi:hypothetical protein